MNTTLTPRDQAVSDILTTAVESGYLWFLYQRIDRDDDLNVLGVTGWIVDDGAPGDHFRLTLAGFRAQLRRIGFSSDERPRLREIARMALVGDLDELDYDVNDADSLLQLAVLGEEVYG